MYKASMFNYKTYIDDKLVIYNSLNGTNSICKVQNEKENKIISWLKPEQEICAASDNDFDILVKKGYLIDIKKMKKTSEMHYMLNICMMEF